MKSAFLNCTCEGKDGIQMFLSFARGSWGTHRCQIERVGAKRFLFCCVPVPSTALRAVLYLRPKLLVSLELAPRSKDVYLGQNSEESGLQSSASNILLNR